MIKTITLVVVLLIAALLIYAATRPDSFRIQRSTTIKAPPEKIFPLINDFEGWRAWSPWENLDPALKRSYSGPKSGKGAVYAWEGNNDVGHGRMEIDESSAPSRIVIKLDFLKPFEAHNIAEYTLAKLLGVFCSMDSMVGSKFEEGLANLKALAEK
jgi:uncharacterized protein YndB with AHSA1/START domain